MGIKLPNNIDIDVSIGYLVNKSYTISDHTSTNMNSTVLGSGLNNPYAGLNYEQETALYMGAIKATMPLEVVTGLLYKSIDLLTPSKWHTAPAKGSLKAAEIRKPVDSSSTIINNLRFEEKNSYIEDSDITRMNNSAASSGVSKGTCTPRDGELDPNLSRSASPRG